MNSWRFFYPPVSLHEFIRPQGWGSLPSKLAVASFNGGTCVVWKAKLTFEHSTQRKLQIRSSLRKSSLLTDQLRNIHIIGVCLECMEFECPISASKTQDRSEQSKGRGAVRHSQPAAAEGYKKSSANWLSHAVICKDIEGGLYT